MRSKFTDSDYESEGDLERVFEYDSPVEFILITTFDGRKTVIARSKGAKIDLLYYSHFSDIKDKEFKSNLIDMFYPSIDDLSPLSIDSRPVPPPRNQSHDDRDSSFTFVWRGVGGHEFTKGPQRILDDVAPILISSFAKKSQRDIEWLLSPIVAKCAESVAQARTRRLTKAARLKITIGTVLGYALISVAAYFYFYPLK